MKIVEILDQKEETEQHAQKQIEKKTVFIGSTKLTPGHRVFQIDTNNMECTEAEYEAEVHYNSPNRRKIIIKLDCAYICALNKKNAIKRYNRENNPLPQ